MEIDLFDPLQFKEYGGMFFEHKNFSYRYQQSKKLFYEAQYVPFGPVVKDLEGMKDFLQYISLKHFFKVKIDLPLLLNSEVKNAVLALFKKFNFQESEYVQDEETILVSKENFNLNSRNERYVRQGMREFSIEIVQKISETDLKKCYEVYSIAAHDIGFAPKNFQSFVRINESSLSSIARDKVSNEICGFLLGFKSSLIGEKRRVNVLKLIYTGINEKGKQGKLGFALHKKLFCEALENYSIDLIDFQGASRSKKRSYVGFKMNFGGEFVQLPGSFEKKRYL